MRTALLILICFSISACLPREETRPRRYSALLNEWRKLDLVDHFPERIPADASHVRLSACPGLLQGGGWFQVRFNLPPERIARIYEDATKQAKAFYDGDDSSTMDWNPKTGKLPATKFDTSGLPKARGQVRGPEFPADYRIFILDAVPYEPGTEAHWNHGKSRGVVISRERNDIIYYAESW